MKTYQSHDLPLIATLLHEGCNLLDVDRSQHRAEFIFEDTPELRSVVDEYMCGTLMCPAHSLLGSLRRAKHILYDYQT